MNSRAKEGSGRHAPHAWAQTSHQGLLRTKDGVIVTSLSEGLGGTWGFGDGGYRGLRRGTRRMVLQRWASSSGSWRNTPKVAALDCPAGFLAPDNGDRVNAFLD